MSTSLIFRILLSFLLTYLPAQIDADPSESLPEIHDCEVVYYDVTGESASELIRRMTKESGIKGNYFGSTNYWWTYDCKTLQMKCVVKLPRWANQNEINNQELLTNWDSFLRGLTLHEQGHVDIINKKFDIERIMKTKKKCRAMKYLLKKKTNEVNKEFIRYDELTGHGVTQGAVIYHDEKFQAIAYSKRKLRYGYAYGLYRSEVAENESLKNCKEEDCKVIGVVKNTCIALSVDKTSGNYFWATGKEKKLSEERSLRNCIESGENCELFISTCPDG